VLNYIFFGVGAFLCALMVARWFSTAAPRVMLVVLKRLAIGLLMVTAVFFIVTGRLSWLVYLAPPVFIWLMRFRSWARTAQTFANMSRGGGGGRTSDIRTRFLRLSLDHDSGVLSGEILEGTYVGRAIERLSRGELVDLLHACERDDLESVQVLEAYLDRIHPDWRARTGEAGGRGSSISGQIDRDEAYRVLGLESGAGVDQVKAAYHRLMAGLHPDHGGSTYLAAKLNEAKDVLLG
jgi:hypothetical protein